MKVCVAFRARIPTADPANDFDFVSATMTDHQAPPAV